MTLLLRFCLGAAIALLAVIVVASIDGCHQLYPEDVTSLRAADQQLLSAYQQPNSPLTQAHIRAAFCNEESVERRHAAGVLDTTIIICTPPRK